MRPDIEFTRRDFLKLSAAGALSLFLSETGLARALQAPSLPARFGRCLMSGIHIYDYPSFSAPNRKLYGKDHVVPLTAAEEGEPGNNPYNNVWYKVGNEGYTYSGWVQPVETVYNKPEFNIPGKGRVGEITVPHSTVRYGPNTLAKTGFRLYYQTTHWVRRTVVNREQKSIWYEIYDFHLRKLFYVPSFDMRLIPEEELAPLSPDVPEALKSILIDLTTQSMTAFEGEKLVLVARCSTGARGTETPEGTYLTYHKGPTVHMTNDGDAEANIYDLPGVPWVTFFTGTGISFHGTYWHNDYGRPRSHGCVNLTSEQAKFIYRWTRPVVPPDTHYLYAPGEGTRVHVIKS